MAVVEDLNLFPNNVVVLMTTRFQNIDEDIFVARRPLRESDPNQSIGVFAEAWMPDDESLEMRGAGPGQHLTTLNRYLISVQAFVKDMDEARGLATHNTFGNIVRRTLYHDDPLRLALNSLDIQGAGSGERLMKWGVRNQRYFSNEIKGTWLYLSTLEFWIETESY